MRRRCTQSGHALAGTLVLLVLAALLWMVVYRHTAGLLRAERACRLRSERSMGCTRALACGLSLLETGLPPQNPYSCRVLLAGEGGGQYVLTFTETEALAYTVSTRPATEDDSSLPYAPDNFGSP